VFFLFFFVFYKREEEERKKKMTFFDGVGDEEEEEDNMSGIESIDLFWKGVVRPGKDLLVSGVDAYFLRITNASLGPDVKKDTRTCLTVLQQEDGESSTGVICTLKNTYENHKLDLLVSGDVRLQVSGKNASPIYLVGHLSPSNQHVVENPFDIDEDEEDELTEEELGEMDAQTKKHLLKLGRKGLAGIGGNPFADEISTKKPKTASGKEKATNPPQDKNQNKNKNQKNNDKANNQKPKKDTVESPRNDNGEDQPWKNGPQGLKFKDVRVGDGKTVQKGSKVRVYYVGQLDNKTVFDKSISGPGFAFTLGAGEVIKGWDLGVNGMKVGGKRRLQIPAKLAYGEGGSQPDIPPNAQLTFTVEVKGAK